MTRSALQKQINSVYFSFYKEALNIKGSGLVSEMHFNAICIPENV